MAEAVLGRGTIELVADARKLKAGIEEAKKSLRTLGEGQKDISAGASQSIDKYIGKLQQQNATLGKTTREVELFKLALRGASNEQLNAANAALKFAENQERMQTVVAGLRTGLIALGVAAATAFTVKTIGSIDFLDKLNDLHKATGISVEDLAGLSLLAKQTGTDLDGLAKGINKMSVELGKDPGKFRELGVTATDSVGAFKQLADIFNTIPDISLRNALAQKVFSKSWQELAPALSEGSRGISEAIEKGTRLSGITTEMAREADKFNDRLAELKIAGAAFGASLIPTLTKIVDLFISAKGAASDFFGSIGSFFDRTKNDARDLQFIEERLAKLKKQRDDLAKLPIVPPLGFLDKQIAALEGQMRRHPVFDTTGVPELGSHLSAEQDDAAEATRARAAKEASARARQFLTDPKEAAARARSEAAAQLAFDLDQIKKSSDATIGAFSNAERIMESLRSASLVDDRDYYASKLGFIRLNAREQEAALQEQIRRLEREKFSGDTAVQDRLNRDRKVLDLEAQLRKVRADSAASGQINAIQESAALKRVEQSLIDATKASDAYIESVARRNQAELAGIGLGNKARDVQAGINQIKDKLITERQRIERDRRNNPQISSQVFDDYLRVAEETYKKEVDLHNKRTAAITESETNWVNGAKEALANYYEESRNIARQTEAAFTNAFKGLEDALVEFATTGKLTFKSLANSILADLNRIAIKEGVTGPLAKGLSGALGGGGGLLGLLGLGGSGVSNFTVAGSGDLVGLLPAFDKGISYVPEDMLAMVHKGERVVPAAENKAGWGPTVHQSLTFHLSSPVTREAQSQIAARVGESTRRAIARNT